MRLLIWSQYFWPENFLINDLAQLLKNEGVEVTVLTGKPNYPQGNIYEGYRAIGVDKENYDGIDVYRVPLFPRGRKKGWRLALNYLSFIASGYVIAPCVLRKKEFDAMLVFGLSPLLQALPAVRFSKKRNTPMLLWVQDLWPQSLVSTNTVNNSWLLKQVDRLVRYIYQNTTLVLVQSHAFIKVIAPYLTANQNKPVFFPNFGRTFAGSVDNVPPALVEQLRSSKSFVFTGNLGSVQGLDTVLDAAKILQALQTDAKIYLIGNGSERSAIEKIIQVNTLDNVRLMGALPLTAMPIIYDAAFSLLLTLGDDVSLTQTIPSKTQAYLQSGKPIIASANGEAATVVAEAKAGLVSAAHDAKALADNMMQLIRMNEEERNTLGKNGRQYYESHFEPTQSAKQLLELLKQQTLEMKGNS